ncbi:unnamed protein product [Candida verbasci]|uniref:Fork-head domain-containing protein n=1 Tax=Candida verbasci TaxID=1227364 RepID=A0A9W4TV24_9ASCO|nr:unnamed protein product [Candida verbasci]
MTRIPLKEASNLELTPSKSSYTSSSTTEPTSYTLTNYNYNDLDFINSTTPPDSIFNKSSTQFETPIKSINLNPNVLIDSKLFPSKDKDQNNSSSSKQNLISTSYLSPAFSSPQNSITKNNTQSSPIKKKSTTSSASSSAPFNLNSEDKPPYSYATLIGISILSHPDKRLTLSHIYSWISDTFKFYRKEDVGWQNSIRHNLSLNKAFIKGEKSKDGKGHFWCIKPGHEEQFLKSRSVKKSSYHEVMDQINQATRLNAAKMAAKREILSSPTPNTQQDQEDIQENEKENFPKSQKRKFEEEAENSDHGLDVEEETDLTIIDYNPPPFKKQQLQKTPTISSTPQFIINSPNRPILAERNLTYTSSYNSNFELSPIRTSETGPLLEPITPKQQYQPNLPHSNNNLYHQVLIKRTPKKTPIKNIRTPTTNSIILKKIWNSPSYLDDFYYSPVNNNINNGFNSNSHSKLSKITGGNNLISYDDDEMIMRNLEIHSSPIFESKHIFNWDK